ncbi:hypothetical protein V2J09_003954 [Rumex salicifolius]
MEVESRDQANGITGQDCELKRPSDAEYDLVEIFKPNVLALFETHASGFKANRICSKLGYLKSYKVEVEGQREGIWLLWKEEKIQIEIFQHHQQFIYAKMGSGTSKFNLFTVYAFPTVARRRGLWQALMEAIQGLIDPTFVCGGGGKERVVQVRFLQIQSILFSELTIYSSSTWATLGNALHGPEEIMWEIESQRDWTRSSHAPWADSNGLKLPCYTGRQFHLTITLFSLPGKEQRA